MLDQDIIEGFQQEANQLMQELEGIVTVLEETEDRFPKEKLEEFAQKIDRIMGTVNTLYDMDKSMEGLKSLGQICGLCKALGYKAATLNAIPLVQIFAAFWADTLEVMREIVDAMGDQASATEISKQFLAAVRKRLEWLAKKVTELSPASGAGSANSQIQVDGLLKSLGIG